MRQEVGRWRHERIIQRSLVEITRHREEALGAEEPALRDLRQPRGPKRARKRTAHPLHRTIMVDRHVSLAAAGLVIAGDRRDTLEQCRFAGAVLADDDG